MDNDTKSKDHHVMVINYDSIKFALDVSGRVFIGDGLVVGGGDTAQSSTNLGLVVATKGILIGGPFTTSPEALCIMYNTAASGAPTVLYNTYNANGWDPGTAGLVITSNNSAAYSSPGSGFNNYYATCFISNSGTQNYSCWNFYSLSSANTTAIAYSTIYNGGFAHTSDGTTKQNIKILNTKNSLNKIINIRPVNYQYIQRPDEQRIGFISQEVEQFSPLATTYMHHTWTDKTDSSGNLIYDASGNPEKEDVFKQALNYNDIFVHNVGAVQEIYKLVMQQQATIELLTNRLTALEARLAL